MNKLLTLAAAAALTSGAQAQGVLVQGNIEALQNQKNDIVSSLFHNYTVNMVLSNFILFKKNTP